MLRLYCSVAHSEKNYIHEVMLDNFLDLVIWGHEVPLTNQHHYLAISKHTRLTIAALPPLARMSH
jgi:hypothetical protein